MASYARRGGVLLLALILVMGCWPGLGSASLTEASIVNQGSSRSGTVRVYLSSLSGVNTLNLSLVGGYSDSNGSTYAGGSNLTVSFSGGSLYLTQGGSQKNLGTSFTLKRNNADLSSGVKISQAREPGNLYTGDLAFVVRSGKMYPVAHIFIEDYLYGVLPYEMSNSFPLEALKSQAVAARTYTVAAMDARGSVYDVVDTTNDQVYRGYPGGTARCKQAVDETAGMVMLYNGGIVSANYGASNGGQTESIKNAWGTGGRPYLDVHDDPYDLENTSSIAKRVTISATGTSPDVLISLLKTKLSGKLPSLGYRAGSDSITITEITDVTPHTPMYASPSRLYTKVDFSMRVRATGNTSGVTEQVPGTVTVTLDYFSEMEGLLGLSINGTKNELIEVTKSGGNFVLTARRYGHGLGMSQRGAQQMANKGFSMQQIIGFYYVGVTIGKYNFTRERASSGTGDSPGGPTESAAPETPVEASKSTAVVTLSNPYSTLNLRSQAGTYAPILANLSHGANLTVLATDGVWYKVQYGSLTGYVMGNYLVFPGEQAAEATPSPQPVATATPAPEGEGTQTPAASTSPQALTATVVLGSAQSKLNLRRGPGTHTIVLLRLSHGASLQVLGREGIWLKVLYGTTEGYVSQAYVQMQDAGDIPDLAAGEGSAAAATATPAPVGMEQSGTVNVSAGQTLNLRQWPTAAADIIARLPSGASVTVLATSADWCQVRYGVLEGYVVTSYLRLDTLPVVTATPAPTATPDPSATQDPQQTATPAPDPAATATPQPVATATPQPVTTATPLPASPTAVVTLRTSTSRLNLRKSPSASGEIIDSLAHGTRVQVKSESGGWSEVEVGSLRGYVATEYLVMESGTGASIPVVTATPTPSSSVGKVWERVRISASTALNIRALPTTDSFVVTSIPGGTEVDVISEDATWYYVEWKTYTGYIAKKYTEPVSAASTKTPEPAQATATAAAGLATAEPTATPLPTATPAPSRPDASKVVNRGTVAADSAGAVVYGMADETSANLFTLSAGEAVRVVAYAGEGAQWCDVVTDKTRGYVRRELLTLEHKVGLVQLENASSTLTVRAAPVSGADAVGYVYAGGITLLGEAQDGWIRVIGEGALEGYVSASYVKVP